MARPTKLTTEVEERLVYAISLGVPYRAACEYAGISYQTFLNWRKRAERDHDERFVEFLDHIKRAQGRAAVVLLAQIKKAAERDWRAAAWSLERRYPKSYGRERTKSVDSDDVAPHPGTPHTTFSERDTVSKIAKILAEFGLLSSQTNPQDDPA